MSTSFQTTVLNQIGTISALLIAALVSVTAFATLF
jgi:hypothetical protein